jgi:hypothetical protein
MALITLDFPSGGTGLYGTDKVRMLDGLYAQIGNTDIADNGNCEIVEDPDPNTTGYVFRCDQNSYGGGGNRVTMREVVPGGVTTTVTIFSRMWLSNLPTTTDQRPLPAVWKDDDNEVIAELRVTTTGVITAHNHNGTQIGSTTVPVITATGWFHIEGRLTCSTIGSGTLTVWVEGDEKMALTGLTTSATGTSQIERGVDPTTASTNPAVYFKDTGLSDSTGSDNNGQIGPLVVIDITEDGDVSSGWTSTGATDYGVVSESDPNDADYIEADDSPPAPSVMTLTGLPNDIVGVRGLVTYVRAWKVDSGDATLQTGLSPNGSDWDDGTTKTLTTAPLYYRDVSENSPDTTDPWTPIEVNSAEIRINRTA